MAITAPSHGSIALATSIIQSKPEELTVEEYIHLLRQHFVKGRRNHALSSAYRYLDRSSFWRGEFERVKRAMKETFADNIDLRLENDTLKLELEKSRPRSPTKKRKKLPGEDDVPVTSSPKKQKRDTSPSKAGYNEPEVPVQLDFEGIGEIGNILMRSLYDVHSLVRGDETVDSSTLARHLVRAAATVPQVVLKFIPVSDPCVISGAGSLPAALAAASRSIRLLLIGSGRISQEQNTNGVAGHVIYAFAQMYGKLLDCLEMVSVAEVSKTTRDGFNSSTQKRMSPSKAKSKQPKQTNIKDHESLNLISKFLCGIIEALDPKVQAHKSLFEAFAYITLNKLGARLYLLVFGYARGTSIADEIAISSEPDEIEDTTKDTASDLRAQQLKAGKLEAPYLIHLLTRIMNAAPAHLDAIVMTKTGKPKQASKGSMKGAITISAKERLQRTLVNCMFGEEESAVDDPFRDCLRMPTTNGKALPVPKSEEPEVQEWFKEEVWRLLGWEILSSENGM